MCAAFFDETILQTGRDKTGAAPLPRVPPPLDRSVGTEDRKAQRVDRGRRFLRMVVYQGSDAGREIVSFRSRLDKTLERAVLSPWLPAWLVFKVRRLRSPGGQERLVPSGGLDFRAAIVQHFHRVLKGLAVAVAFVDRQQLEQVAELMQQREHLRC